MEFLIQQPLLVKLYNRILNNLVKLSICLVCFFFLFSDYSAAHNLLSKQFSNPPTHDSSLSFVVWGHPRQSFGEPPLHFNEILELLSELKPDLIFITGDVIEGGLGKYLKNNRRPLSNDIIEIVKKDWDRFDTEMKKLGIPYYITPGNHDIHSVQTRDIFYKRYRKMPFAVTFKGCRFILLDSGGIDNIGINDAAFTGGPIPFNDEQKQFIRNEILRQKEYRHIFFFMHHTQQWADSDGFWWKDIHPLLRGGKTQAVFSANPDGYKFKYSYVVQDDIYYIQSCTFPAGASLGKRIKPLARQNMAKQLDNLQYVKVDGENIKIRTIAVGATTSKGLNRRFWDDAESNPSLTKHIADIFHQKFAGPRDLFFGLVITGCFFFLVGLLSCVIWGNISKKRTLKKWNL